MIPTNAYTLRSILKMTRVTARRMPRTATPKNRDRMNEALVQDPEHDVDDEDRDAK